ncbi:MAG: right-handed parallel beta-helix repeat-containing protein, partial [Candidatus Cloacimonadales bacterium]
MKKVILLITFLLTIALLNSIIYVDSSNTGFEDGSDDHPWNTIVEGIEDTQGMSGDVEIWVADGTYNGDIKINFYNSPNLDSVLLRSTSLDPTQCSIIGDFDGNVIEVGYPDAFGTSRNVTIWGFSITGSGINASDSGIDVDCSTTIQKNIIYDCPIAINADWTGCWNYGSLKAIDNDIYNNDSGINVYKLNNVQIGSNDIYNNSAISVSVGDCESVIVSNNEIDGSAGGVSISEHWYQDYPRDVLIESNYITNNTTFGIEEDCDSNSQYTNLIVNSNIVTLCGNGITIDDPNTCTISHNLIYDNTNAIQITEDIQHSESQIDLLNNTLVANNNGIYSLNNDVIFSTFENNIIWANVSNDIFYEHTPTSSVATISYNCIEYLNNLPAYITTSTDNINVNPLFVTTNNNYELQPSSPCIDAGDYTSDLDPDGTIADMGYKYYEQDIDERNLSGSEWNWISFPRLRIDANEEALSWCVLTILQPELPSTITTLDGITATSGQSYGGVNPQWDPLNYTFDRVSGYKINCPSNDNLTLSVPGKRVEENTPITLFTNQENWVGYFCENSSSPERALESIWDEFQMVKHKEWTYFRTTPGGTVYWLHTSSSVRPGFKYGQMAVIKMYRQQDLVWNTDNALVTSHPKSQVFTYDEKADYTPIHVELEAGSDATEVGVYV